jgi:hypothetical protein
MPYVISISRRSAAGNIRSRGRSGARIVLTSEE